MAAIPAAATKLLAFIASYEAPRGYDTVYANRMASMPKPLTSMTLDEAIADGPRRTRQFGSSACGRFQFMTATLKDLKAAMGLTGREVFTPDLQDRMGYQLLLRRGYAAFMAGSKSVNAFGLALAQEWASFPVLAAVQGAHRPVARGQSFYAGDGLNKALVKPEAVEGVLRSLKGSSATVVEATEATPPILAPRVDTVPGPSIAPQSWWRRLLGRKAPEAAQVSRPGLKPNGDPILWDVQKQLRDRAYYTKGFLDGLDGPLTQGAVAQARKDVGLGDGGVDAVFLGALPTMPQRPVSVERANLPVTQAVSAKPELFNPLGWLGGTGIASLVTGAASGTGLLDNVQSAAGKVNDVAGSIQTAIGYASTIIGFLVEHKTIVFVAIGVMLILKTVSAAADFVNKIRAAFF